MTAVEGRFDYPNQQPKKLADGHAVPMKRILLVLAILVVVAAVGAGGYKLGSDSRNSEVAALKTERAAAEKEVNSWEAREDQLKLREARAPKIPEGQYPDGYPKTVQKSDLPEFLQGDLTTNRAVAVAPGVWADFPKGVDIADVLRSGSLLGRCASIAAYEREYSPGGSYSSTCY